MDKLLKPCPFCESEGLIVKSSDTGSTDPTYFNIICTSHLQCCRIYGKTKEEAIQSWNTRTGETAPTMSEEKILKMMPPEKDESKSRNPVDVTFEVAYNHARKEIARALSGKLSKQPCYGEEELLKMMPPEKDESKSHNPVYVIFEVAYNHVRKEIARALANRLQKPRKVERDRKICK